MPRIFRAHHLVAGAALAFTTLAYTAPADACGRAIELEVEPATVLLAKADKLLEKGDYLAAARKADQSEDSHDATWSQIWWRSRILAQAAIRSNGEVAPGIKYGRAKTKKLSTKRKNVRKAVATLERMLKKEAKADDPVLLSLYGEGLAQLPGRQGEATKVLAQLADDDLITSAQTWAALAELRAQNGDATEATEARTYCQAMVGEGGSCAYSIAGNS